MKNKLMIKIIRISCVSVILLGGIFSCSEDFLDQKPLSSVSDASVWKDIILTEAYVNNIYSLLKAPWAFNSAMSVTSDEGYAYHNLANLVQRGEITPSNSGYIGGYWLEDYTIITNCNIFLDRVAGENMAALKAIDETRTNRMIGEVKALRAYAYFRLSALHGGVPLITKPFGLTEDFKIEKNTYDDVLTFVVQELDEAATLLSLTYTGDNLGRITKGAAMAIKSRALLYAASPLHNPGNDLSKWQQAADAAKAVIDLDLYSLEADYKTMFTVPGNFDKEAIWEIIHLDLIVKRAELERFVYPSGMLGFGIPNPSQNMVDSYETLNGLLPADDPSYDPQNPYANRDPRFYASILYDGAPFKGREIEVFLPGGKDGLQGTDGPNSTRTGYYIRKFIDENITSPNQTNVSSPNYAISRYAEILLNYAEAKFQLGDENTARTYVNMVRSRPSVNMPAVTSSGADLLERIKNERRVELFLEDHRFLDIRRWKMDVPPNSFITKMDVSKNVGTGIKTFTVANLNAFALPEHQYVAPIPQGEIDKNPKLQQNPGY